MHKRTFLKLAGMAGVAAVAFPKVVFAQVDRKPFTLPALPYASNALEPYIDQTTMEIHHGKHHAGYVTNLNNAIAQTAFEGKSIEAIMASIKPTDTAIRNNGGGHYNHTLFWNILSPKGGNPNGALLKAIEKSFQSFEAFQTVFSDKAKGVFGSGWVWLYVNQNKQLAITSTANQDNPLMKNIVTEIGTPILALDVWEHAYYLKHQNKRPAYIESFWKVVNWEQVAKNYQSAIK